MAKFDLDYTPHRLWAALVGMVVATLCLWAVSLAGVSYARSSVQTITKDSVPSVIAAQDIRRGLFKMDGDTVANYLLLTHNRKAIYDINQDRMVLAKQLVLAAQNITYGDAESGPITTMIGRLPMYSELTSPALEGQGNWRARRLLMASDVLHNELEKSANALDKVNRDHLNEAFNESQVGLKFRATLAWLVGVAVLIAFGFFQVVISRLSHRMINIPLALATLMALILVVSNGSMLTQESRTLKSAKLDAFDSVGYLSEAEAVVEDSRAEALYALVPEGKDRSWVACAKDLDSLAQTSGEAELNKPYTTQAPPLFKGLLGNELRNITFDGELDAANAELSSFAHMKQTILALKELPTGSDAVAQAFEASSSIDSVSDETEKAVESTRQINMHEFESERDKSFALLDFPSLSVNILTLLIAALVYFGVRQRLSEYVA